MGAFTPLETQRIWEGSSSTSRPRAVYITAFDPVLAHGGNRRTFQIVGILEAAGYALEVRRFGNDVVSGEWPRAYVRDLAATFRVSRHVGRVLPVPITLRGMVRSFRDSLLAIRIARRYAAVDVYVDHHIRIPLAFLRVLAILHGNVSGIVHNVEALVGGQRSIYGRSGSLRWLEKELGTLRACRRLVVMGRSDALLLGLFGLRTAIVRYKAPDGWNETARVMPRQEPGKYVLFLGTAGNPPTEAGTMEAFRAIRRLAVPVVICGYEWEAAAQRYGSELESIRILDSVDQRVLMEVIADARCIVCWQTPTTGTLTRIPELIPFDKPVFANYVAARSYEDIPMIHVCETTCELVELVAERFASESGYTALRSSAPD